MSGTVAADARDNNADINQTPKLTKTHKDWQKWNWYAVISNNVQMESLPSDIDDDQCKIVDVTNLNDVP